ncbi:MAG TPA: hypothetical protein VF152_00770 [Acidimicrobiia bacterium]
MTPDKVLTKHPEGKRGKSITVESYELFEQAVVAALQRRALTHTELVAALEQSLRGRFGGNVSWYTMTVKLDLEARRVIERTASRPQRYRVRG